MTSRPLISRSSSPTPELSVESPVETPFAGQPVHMIGIGGSGMCGAARLLLQLGAKVSGSDLQPFDTMGDLVQRGARVYMGHDAAHVAAAPPWAVVSAAIAEDNVELQELRRRGVPVVKYSELLGLLMQHRVGIAVAGTHGKSTTTAMCAHVMRTAGFDPSFIVGAGVPQLNGSSGAGRGPHFIVESCEYDRSFLKLRPTLAAILNIESDHLDCYRDLGEIVDAFSELASLVAPSGRLYYNARDELASQAAQAAHCPIESFGIQPGSHWRAIHLGHQSGRFSFDIEHDGVVVTGVRLGIPGRHNVENALAAAVLALQAGAAPQLVGTALSGFTGISRRLTWRGQGGGVNIVDDYAHHPTEVKVSIEAVRECYAPRRLHVIFQPHQRTRIRALMEEFSASFGGADEVVVLDVYAARESKSIGEGNESAELARRIQTLGVSACYVPALSRVADHVAAQVRTGDLLLTMGAGDVWKVADELVERFCGSTGVRRSPRSDDLVPAGRSGAIPVPTA